MAFSCSSDSGVNPVRASTECPGVIEVGGTCLQNLHRLHGSHYFTCCVLRLEPLPPSQFHQHARPHACSTSKMPKAADKPEVMPWVSRGGLSPCQPSCTSMARDAHGGKEQVLCRTLGATSHMSLLSKDDHWVPGACWPSCSNEGEVCSHAQTLRLIPEEQTQTLPAVWTKRHQL